MKKMRTKLIKVLDYATEMYFVIAEFDPDDYPLLKKTGWGIDPPPKLIIQISTGAAACISAFDHPPYDIPKRSHKLGVNNTTLCLATWVKNNSIDTLPGILDFTKVKSKYLQEEFEEEDQ
jgi:hypothetical protein